jgi:hypothetical protein
LLSGLGLRPQGANVMRQLLDHILDLVWRDMSFQDPEHRECGVLGLDLLLSQCSARRACEEYLGRPPKICIDERQQYRCARQIR